MPVREDDTGEAGVFQVVVHHARARRAAHDALRNLECRSFANTARHLLAAIERVYQPTWMTVRSQNRAREGQNHGTVCVCVVKRLCSKGRSQRMPDMELK